MFARKPYSRCNCAEPEKGNKLINREASSSCLNSKAVSIFSCFYIQLFYIQLFYNSLFLYSAVYILSCFYIQLFLNSAGLYSAVLYSTVLYSAVSIFSYLRSFQICCCYQKQLVLFVANKLYLKLNRIVELL